MRRLGENNFRPMIIQYSTSRPGFPQHAQITLCTPPRSEISGCRYPESVLVLVPKELEYRPE